MQLETETSVRGQLVLYVNLRWSQWVHTLFTGRFELPIEVEQLRKMVAAYDRAAAAIE